MSGRLPWSCASSCCFYQLNFKLKPGSRIRRLWLYESVLLFSAKLLSKQEHCCFLGVQLKCETAVCWHKKQTLCGSTTAVVSLNHKRLPSYFFADFQKIYIWMETWLLSPAVTHTDTHLETPLSIHLLSI